MNVDAIPINIRSKPIVHPERAGLKEGETEQSLILNFLSQRTNNVELLEEPEDEEDSFDKEEPEEVPPKVKSTRRITILEIITKRRKFSIFKSNIKEGGQQLGSMLTFFSDIFDKSINMQGQEIALMDESMKTVLEKKLWTKQKRYDLLQLISALAGTILGCIEALLYYNQIAELNSEGGIVYKKEGETHPLRTMRILCSVFAFTASTLIYLLPLICMRGK
jgi:hypothetical protein